MRTSLNVIVSFAGGAAAAAIGLLVLPLYLRFLGAEAYGLVGFLATLQAWFLLLDLGLASSASREMARFRGGEYTAQAIRDLLRTLEFTYAFIAVLLGTGLALTAHWLSAEWLQLRTLSVQEATGALAWMGLWVALQWMAALYRSALNGLQRQVWLAGVTAASAMLRAASGLAVLAWVSADVKTYVLAQCAALLLEAAVLRLHLWHQLPSAKGHFRIGALRSLWRFAAALSLLSVVATVVSHADRLVLSRLLTLESFGYFSLAMAAVGVLSVAVAPVFDTAYARLAELIVQGRTAAIQEEYHALTQVACMILLPPATGLLLFAPQAVHAWTGDAQLTAHVAPLISVWAIGATINGLLHMPHALQLASGWVRLSLGLNIVTAMVSLPCLLLLVPAFGVLAAGWIWAGVNVFYATVGLWLMHARLLPRELRKWYVVDVGAPLAACMVVAGMLRVLASTVEPFSRLGSGLAFVACILCSAGAAIVACPQGRVLLRALLLKPALAAPLRQ